MLVVADSEIEAFFANDPRGQEIARLAEQAYALHRGWAGEVRRAARREALAAVADEGEGFAPTYPTALVRRLTIPRLMARSPIEVAERRRRLLRARLEASLDASAVATTSASTT